MQAHLTVNRDHPFMTSFFNEMQWRSEGPAGPVTAGGPAGLKGPARGPQGRSSRLDPLARGPNKLFAGGPENRRYATDEMWTSTLISFRCHNKNNIIAWICLGSGQGFPKYPNQIQNMKSNQAYNQLMHTINECNHIISNED